MHVTEFGEGCSGDKARKVVWGSPRLEEAFESCSTQFLLVTLCSKLSGCLSTVAVVLERQALVPGGFAITAPGAQRSRSDDEGHRRSAQGQSSMQEGSVAGTQGTKALRGEERRCGARDLVWAKSRNNHLLEGTGGT